MQYGGEEVGLGAARELYARADIREPLERVFAVADLDGNGKLSYAEFLLFMYLLKVLRKGVTLPRVLSNERVSPSCLLHSSHDWRRQCVRGTGHENTWPCMQSFASAQKLVQLRMEA